MLKKGKDGQLEATCRMEWPQAYSNFLIRFSIDSVGTSFHVALPYLHSLVITPSMHADLHIV